MIFSGSGLDVTGLVDRAVVLDWPARTNGPARELVRPVVIAPAERGGMAITGAAARAHPAGRGWRQPAWATDLSRRRHVADLLPGARRPAEQDRDEVAELLGAHLRHLAGDADQVGLAVADDLTAEARDALFSAVARALRFVRAEGGRAPRWRGLTADPVWRSVAAVFAWGAERTQDELEAMKTSASCRKRVRVLSLLGDRVTLAELLLDAEEAGGRWLVTPERERAGQCLGDNPAAAFERQMCDDLRAEVGDQVRALGLEGELADGRPETLFQDADGRWIRPSAVTRPADRVREMRILKGDVASLGLGGVLDGLGPDDVLLVETPDPERRLLGSTLADMTVKCLMAARDRQAPVFLLPADAVARGAAEYRARLSAGVPTFYDHLPRLEIVAHLSETEIAADAEERRFAFVPLFEEATRVPGNREFLRALEGRFVVGAGARELKFHLWKEDDAVVRFSETRLPVAPERDVPIGLIVTQRPVGGHASIAVRPKVSGALGGSDPALDWQSMVPLADTRAAILKQLEADTPFTYPHCAPLPTATALWQNARGGELKLHRDLCEFLTLSVRERAYPAAVEALRKSIGRLQTVTGGGMTAGGRQSVCPISSAGEIPPDAILEEVGLRGAAIVTALRDKIDWDIRDARARPVLFGDLVLLGSWMHAAAPAHVVNALRAEMGTRRLRMKKISQALGRALAADDDVAAALRWLAASIRLRRKDTGSYRGTFDDLKGAALLMQYRRAACRLLTTEDAVTFVQCANGLLNQELKTDGKKLRQTFLWSVRTLLLVLRHRQKAPDFLAPDATTSRALDLYRETRETLERANIAITMRSAHALSPALVGDALDFIDRNGRDPNIIRTIAAEEVGGE